MSARKAAAALLLAGAAVAALTSCATENTSPTTSCHVVDKDHTYSSDGPVYRVYTDDCGTFQVADSFLHGTWNSADLYSSIVVGHEYEFTSYGPRNGFFSMFPNITAAKDVTP